MITIEVNGKEATFSLDEKTWKWRGKDKAFIKELNDNAPIPDEDYTASTSWREGLDGVTGRDSVWYEKAVALFGKSVKIVSYERDPLTKVEEGTVY